MQLLWRLPAILVTVLVGGVPLLTWAGLLPPSAFFKGFVPGVILAVVSTTVLGAAGALAAASGRPWRRDAVRAGMIPLFFTIAILVVANRGAGHPIHDISTDPVSPLEFTEGVLAKTQPGRGEVEPEQLAAIQAEKYPDIVPLVIASQPNQVFERAIAAARAMPDWEVTNTLVQDRRIEAEATSRIFRFVDDVAIEVRVSDRGGSRVDIRSRSRMGRSDLGANAERIRAYLANLSGRFLEGQIVPATP